MKLTEEQQHFIERIDLRAKALLKEGCSESGLMVELWDFISNTHSLLNEITPLELQSACQRYTGFQAFVSTLQQKEG